MARSNRQMSTTRFGRTRSAARGARRVWPYVLMAWERWQSLSPDEKERYKKQARGYADRGKAMLDSQRTRKPLG